LATQHVHAEAAVLYPEASPAVGNLRSARDLLSQISHSCECGARRFLFWWLYLHRRLRPGNEAQDCSRATWLSPGFYFQRLLPVVIRALKKASQLSLASLSASTLGVNGSTAACFSSLPGVTASFADPCVGHRNPQAPRHGGLYSEAIFSSNFYVFYFLCGVNLFSGVSFPAKIL